MNQLIQWDQQLFLALNLHPPGHLFERFFLTITDLGSAYWAISLSTVTLLLLYRKQAVKTLVVGAGFSIAIAAITFILKHKIGRLRPASVLPQLAHSVGQELYTHSFPSGHAMSAFAVLGFLYVIDRRLFYIWLPFSILVAWSRIYIGAHFPLDVLGGAVLGFVPAVVVAHLFRLRLYRPRNRLN